jgi:high-affinity iron transporter
MLKWINIIKIHNLWCAMFSSSLLALREGLEAALVVGIVLGALRKMNQARLAGAVWTGVAAAAIVSGAAAVALTLLGYELKDPAEAIFEGLTMLLAAGILTWMIFWMSRQSQKMQAELEAGVQKAAGGGGRALFALAFVAVLREGVELALFLTAATFSSNTSQTVLGALLGLGVAVLLGWLLFAASIRINLKKFFTVTSILLIFFAAGLVGRGVGELVEMRWFPAFVEHVWDVGNILSEESVLGQTLGALFGYSASPSLMQMLAYIVYFVAALLGLRASYGSSRLVDVG